jgi:hypothetical protein
MKACFKVGYITSWIRTRTLKENILQVLIETVLKGLLLLAGRIQSDW